MDLSKLSDSELLKLYNKAEEEISALDNLQMALKISLNSLYGGIGNQGFRFFNSNVAETITLTGQYVLRSIEQSIDDKLNKVFKTEGHKYLIYIDTDSVVGDTKILVNGTETTIADYYDSKTEFIKRDEFNKDYVKKCDSDYTPTVNPNTQVMENKSVSYVMKHRVKKRMYKITVGGKEVICTNDHSIIVRRNSLILSVIPSDILKTDELIHIKH
jgi:DNA polymerase elongation subunit (family B)